MGTKAPFLPKKPPPVWNGSKFHRHQISSLFCLADVCLADVCNVLDLQPSAVMRRPDDGVTSNRPILDSLGREQLRMCLHFYHAVNEDGLYSSQLLRVFIQKRHLPSLFPSPRRTS